MIFYPDLLAPLNGPFDLEPGQAQPVWISVRVPNNAAPGVYQGKIQARAGAWSAEFPLSIRVWDFALPDTPARQRSFGISYDLAADFEGVKLEEAVPYLEDPRMRRDTLFRVES